MVAELATLCQACGLCCDGSLFGYVALEPDEISHARKSRLRVVENGKGFEQPCAALSSLDADRRACGVYDERPRSCRRFVCRLLDRHRREGGSLEPRLAAVRRVRELVAELRARGLTSADFDGAPDTAPRPDAQATHMFAELQRLLEDNFARA